MTAGVLEPSSYAPRLLSATAGAAALTLLVVLVSVALMRGAPALRAWLLLSAASLLTTTVALALALSAVAPNVQLALVRVAAAPLPLAAGAGLCFQLTLIGALRGRGWLAALVVLVGGAWAPIIVATELVIARTSDGVRGAPAAVAGPLAIAAVAHAVLVSGVGLVVLGRAVRGAVEPAQRRQWRRMWWASTSIIVGVVASTGVDARTGVPVGWLLIAAGALAVLGALWFDDLLRVRAIDTRLPLLLVYLAFSTLVGWAALETVAVGLPWWVVAALLMASFVAARLGVAGVLLLARGGVPSDGPLARIQTQFAVRAAAATSEQDAWVLARDTIELATGIKVERLAAGAGDAALLAPHDRLLVRDELELTLDAARRPALRALLERTGAAALLPVCAGGELVTAVVVPQAAQARLHRAERQFLTEIAPRLATALRLGQVAERAHRRVAAERDLELAAAMQTGFVPPFGVHVLPGLTLAGVWQPASRASGDFWTFYELGGGRVLLAMGDVTGHGVSAALVTAAAKGAADVAVRTTRGDPGPAVMAALDAAVRRVGAGRLQMTCGVALLDPQAGHARVYAAGHGSPLRLRRGPDGATELTPMLAHGSPLGADGVLGAAAEHALAIGDVVIWYSDGLTDIEDPAGKQFGERRLLRLLRAMPPTALDVTSVRDAILAALAEFRGERPQPDDLTLLVAEVTA